MTGALEKSCCSESIWQAAYKENNAKEGDVGYLILLLPMTSSTMHDNLESPQGREEATESIVGPKQSGVGVERGGAGVRANQPQKGVISLCVYGLAQ